MTDEEFILPYLAEIDDPRKTMLLGFIGDITSQAVVQLVKEADANTIRKCIEGPCFRKQEALVRATKTLLENSPEYLINGMSVEEMMEYQEDRIKEDIKEVKKITRNLFLKHYVEL